MKNNPLASNLIDCGLGWLIAFMSALIATQDLSLRIVLISFVGAGIPALIKLRTYVQGSIQTKMFY